MKFEKGNEVIEDNVKNNHSAYLRAGWKEVKETKKVEKVKK